MTRRQSPLVPSAKIPPIRIHFWPRAFRLPENFRREIQARGQDADVVVIVVVRAYVGGEDVVYPEYRYSNRELREAFSTYHRPIRSPASRYSLSVRRNERSRLFIPGKFSPQIVASIDRHVVGSRLFLWTRNASERNSEAMARRTFPEQRKEGRLRAPSYLE